MATTTTTTTTVVVTRTLAPKPGLGVVRFREGIVEIALRIACIVFSFAAFIAACVTVSDADDILLNGIGLANSISSAAGWIIFVSLMAMLTQGAIIALRFLNFSFINNHFGIFLFVDIGVAVFFVLAYFAGAVPLAVYADDWGDLFGNSPSSLVRRIEPDAGATSAFSFLSMFLFIALAVWMVLFLVFKWNDKSGQSSGQSSGGGDGSP